MDNLPEMQLKQLEAMIRRVESMRKISHSQAKALGELSEQVIAHAKTLDAMLEGFKRALDRGRIEVDEFNAELDAREHDRTDQGDEWKRGTKPEGDG